MAVTTGLSGNELFCLAKKGFTPGDLVIGNSVHALGMIGSIQSGFRAVLGGEIKPITALIEEGRRTAYNRMHQEALDRGGQGITGVTSELVFHGSTIEFLAIGSVINGRDTPLFSTAADGQELYAQLDAGYAPVCFAFGNVAYSIGVGRGILGSLKTLARGEIKEFSDMFNHTRHLALERIVQHAKQHKANAVVGIKTTILPFGGVNEMLMLGTASIRPTSSLIPTDAIITSDLTTIEMWNLIDMGYEPLRLLLGTSVYSLGFIGGITAALKSFVRGEINELTRMVYDARENAIAIMHDEATAIGADDVVGIKTYVYQLGNGLIEFLAIGTAVKKTPAMKPLTETLPVQAIVVDKDTFYDSTNVNNLAVNMNAGSKPMNTGILPLIIFIAAFSMVSIQLIHVFFR